MSEKGGRRRPFRVCDLQFAREPACRLRRPDERLAFANSPHPLFHLMHPSLAYAPNSLDFLLHSAPMPAKVMQGLGKSKMCLDSSATGPMSKCRGGREYSQLPATRLHWIDAVATHFWRNSLDCSKSDNVVPSITLRTFIVQQQPIDRSAARSLLCCLALLFLSNATAAAMGRIGGGLAPLSVRGGHKLPGAIGRIFDRIGQIRLAVTIAASLCRCHFHV